MAQPFFVDSLAPLTEDAIAYLLDKSGGQKPLAWGRYLDAELSRDIDVAAKHGIPLLLIARRSSRVCLDGVAGVKDGSADRARCETVADLAKSRGAHVLRATFLDVEMKPNLAADYWRAWSAAFDGARAIPCAYMPNRNFWPASWTALEAAIAAGARCGGSWTALYHQPVDGSAVLRDEDWTTRAKASALVPELGWQHSGNAYASRYDFSSVNPDGPRWWEDFVDVAPTDPAPPMDAPHGGDAALEAAFADAPSTSRGDS